jgi:hypothetical protein
MKKECRSANMEIPEPAVKYRRTATLRAHDGDDGIGEAALSKLHLLREILQALHVEVAVAVDELRGAAVVLHHRIEIEVAESEDELE